MVIGVPSSGSRPATTSRLAVLDQYLTTGYSDSS
jgi:hypothetical protein